MLFPKAAHWYTSSENSQEERTVSTSVTRCACETHGQLSANTVPLKGFLPPQGLQYINKYTGMGAKIHTKISSSTLYGSLSLSLSLSLSHTHTHTHTHTLLSEAGTKRVKVYKTKRSTKKRGQETRTHPTNWLQGIRRESQVDAENRDEKNSNKLLCSPVRIYCHWVQVTSLLLILLSCRVYESQTGPLKAVLAPLNTQLLCYPPRPEETQG